MDNGVSNDIIKRLRCIEEALTKALACCQDAEKLALDTSIKNAQWGMSALRGLLEALLFVVRNLADDYEEELALSA